MQLNFDCLLIGYACYSMGDYDKALEYFGKALEIRESKLGKDHPSTATTYNNIAEVYQVKGDYDKALEYHGKALEIRESKLGKDHPSTATTYNNIAMVYYVKGNYDKTLEYYGKALKIYESKLGKDHPSTATTYNNIAMVYYAKGDYDKALEYFVKTKYIFESKLGKDHPDTATTYNNIATVYLAKGDHAKALEYHKKALEIRESKLGTYHPDTASTYNNIAEVYRTKGENDNALEYHKKALKIRESKLGKDHPDTAITYNNIALVYQAKGDYDNALNYYGKALEIQESKLGEDHPYTATTYSNIAQVYYAKGNYDKALEYYEKAKAKKMTKPEMNYQEAITNDTIDAKEYEEKGDYEKAIQLYDEDLRINEEKLNKIPSSVTITSFKNVFDSSTENHFWSQMIYHNLLNFIYYYYNGIWRNGFDIIDNWQKQLNNNGVPVLDQFSDYIDSIIDGEEKKALKSLKNILQETKKLSTYKKNSSANGFLCIDCKENNNNLVNFGDKVLNNRLFKTSKLFDFSYAQSLDSETILSSGEQELLNLFSRIYDAIELSPKEFANSRSSYLLMLDEAEIGFHPDWQRRYLNLIVGFLNELGKIKQNKTDFQIIISTHSPILLSDIPKCCTNYLKVENGNTINANRDEIGETFAENVFQLYRRSFFMEDGLVGEFARHKIRELENRIDEGETEGVLNEIRMIGDDGIREYLIEKFHQMHPELNSVNERLIEYYKEKISQLQGGKEH